MQVSFMGLLCVAFVVLKLLGVITWSWLWVTAPLWGGFVLAMLFYTLAFFAINWSRGSK